MRCVKKNALSPLPAERPSAVTKTASSPALAGAKKSTT
jgi:hypothetical protein